VSAQEQNLKVLTDHIRDLATKQQAAAGRIKVANESVGEVAGSMWGSHGVACAATNMAVSAAETARATAGTHLYQVSTKLSENLNYAADNYDDVDYREGRSIGTCGL
jgi:Excreted virulence factor EspC, type VII ESX diderm